MNVLTKQESLLPPACSKDQAVLRVALAIPLLKNFDYLLPDNCSVEQCRPGIRIQVPFGSRTLVGVIVDTVIHTNQSKSKLKAAYKLLDEVPILPKKLLALCVWASQYYHDSLGEIIANALPALLRQGKPAEFERMQYYQLTSLGLKYDLALLKRAPKQVELMSILKKEGLDLSRADLRQRGVSMQTMNTLVKKELVRIIEKPLLPKNSSPKLAEPLILTEAQAAAVSAINASKKQFSVFLLDGVTGSGKTQVYLDAIKYVIQLGCQALVLVPEIGLTPQTIERFQAYFSEPVVAFHSGLNDTERCNAWMLAKEGIARIVIGTRSAVFVPLKNPGLFIVDEEHDASFKQQDRFRYSARDLIVVRAQMENVPLVLGSATPSLETLYNVQRKRYQYLNLPFRAGSAIQPTFRLLDVRNQRLEQGLSSVLMQAIRSHIDRGQQVLIFLNRRGYAPVYLCHGCGWVAACSRCDAKMTYHQSTQNLRCHHCDKTQAIIKTCPECLQPALCAVGLGTERLEEVLQKHFPKTGIVRVDRDSTRGKKSFAHLLKRVHTGEPQILLGTQMLAKGHHFPNVTLVAIVNIDQGLFSADFRALERMAQLVIQVGGRAGRSEKPGEVLLQTHHPEHPLLQKLIYEGYDSFARALLSQRQQAGLPPFGYIALLRADATQPTKPLAFLRSLKELILKKDFSVKILGPAPSPMLRKAGRYRAQLFLQANHRQSLQAVLGEIHEFVSRLPIARQVRWSLDVDPVDIF